MFETLKEFFKQPFWVMTLILGVIFIGLPCVTLQKDEHWVTHSPTSWLLAGVGIALLVGSFLGYGRTLFVQRAMDEDGLDLTCVKESQGVFSTTVSNCKISVIEGRIEEYVRPAGCVAVLPCNEYFDDRCVSDTKSALGAYVNRLFAGEIAEFTSLVRREARGKLGPGKMQQKTAEGESRKLRVWALRSSDQTARPT